MKTESGVEIVGVVSGAWGNTCACCGLDPVRVRKSRRAMRTTKGLKIAVGPAKEQDDGKQKTSVVATPLGPISVTVMYEW